MSTNSILVVLYIELALFIVGIVGPVALRLLEGLKQEHGPSEHEVPVDRRDVVVSRLTT